MKTLISEELFELAQSKGFDGPKETSLSELQTWLRNKHSVLLFVLPHEAGFTPIDNSALLSLDDLGTVLSFTNWKYYNTYEEALEKGLEGKFKELGL